MTTRYLEYLPKLQMYKSLATAPENKKIMAWVNIDPEIRTLCEVEYVDGNNVEVITPAGSSYFVSRARVHQVHTVSLYNGAVIKFYGEPKSC